MKIKTPKVANPMRVSGKKEVSRTQRRHAEINVNGKNVKILEHIRKEARKLSFIINKETGKEINHEENLKAIYMINGIAGVNDYLMACRKVFIESQGGLVPYYFKKIKAFLIIFVHYIKRKKITK